MRLPSDLGIGIKLPIPMNRFTCAKPGMLFHIADANNKFTNGPENEISRLAHLGPDSRNTNGPIHEMPIFFILRPQIRAAAMCPSS